MDVSHAADRFGFSEYAVVLHADAAQLAAIVAFRRKIELRRAMYEAHVTLKGPIGGIQDLDAVRNALANAAKQQSPFAIEFAAQPYDVVDTGLLVPVQLSTRLVEVQRCVAEALSPLSEDPDSTAIYHPHLTLCFGCTSEQLAKARPMAKDVHLGTGFTATAFDLMARTGHPLHGGYCTLIDSFPLRGVDSGRHDELRSLYRTMTAGKQ